MTDTTARPDGVVVDYDPAAWLPGPTVDPDDDAAVAAWVDGAVQACVSDFRLEETSEAAAYLRDLVTGFATAPLACDFRFLRLRTLDDPPLIARLNLLEGMPADGVEEMLGAPDDNLPMFDQRPQVAVVDEARQLRRWMLFGVGDGIRPLVRYHRRVDQWDLDLVLSCAGSSLKATALGLADLDALAQATWVVDENGARW